MHDDDILRLLTDVAVAGHTGDEQLPRHHLDHPDPRIRAVALNALDRLGTLDDATLVGAMNDPDSAVRRRSAEICATHVHVDLTPLLHDIEPLVIEMAAWACGEQMQPDDDDSRVTREWDVNIIDRLIHLATDHDEALVRESAIAALGAIGDERAVPAIISGCSDKPAVRRRAVLALAPFSGDDVDRALHRALEDRDWQVRQAAEDVLGPE